MNSRKTPSSVAGNRSPLTEVHSLSLTEWKDQRSRWRSFSFFQTPEWLEILCKAFTVFKNRSVILQGDSGQSLLLPVIENRKAPRLYTWLSLPYGTYGGPLAECENGEVDGELLCAFLEEQKFSAINITFPPGQPAPAWKGYGRRQLTTQILDLRHGFQRVEQGCFSAACRRAIRKAERSQIEVQILNCKEHFEPFWALYEQSMKRWGLSKGFPQQLFQLLWADPSARFWGAFAQGRLAAAALVLTHGAHQYYWLGVMDEAAQHLRPNNLLFSSILEQSCRDGIQTFDLGNSDGLIGVFNFKKSFGPEVATYSQLYHAGPLAQGYHRLRALLKGRPTEP